MLIIAQGGGLKIGQILLDYRASEPYKRDGKQEIGPCAFQNCNASTEFVLRINVIFKLYFWSVLQRQYLYIRDFWNISAGVLRGFSPPSFKDADDQV